MHTCNPFCEKSWFTQSYVLAYFHKIRFNYYYIVSHGNRACNSCHSYYSSYFYFIYTFIKDLLLMSTSYFSYYLSNSDKYFFSRNNISLFYMIKQLERQEYNISKQNVC